MTDNEIIKALECCKRPVGTGACKDCPLDKDRPCTTTMIENALDLINRQKAEIKKCENIIRLADKTIEKQSAEIKRLEQENFDRSLTVETWKCEAVKEFAERLKAEKFEHQNFGGLIYYEDVDNLVKEMVGDDNEL